MATYLHKKAASPWPYLYFPASAIGRDAATGKVWLAYATVSGGIYTLWCVESLDGGATWETPVSLYTAGASVVIASLQVLVTGGKVHCFGHTSFPDILGFVHARRAISGGAWTTYYRGTHGAGVESGIYGRSKGVESAVSDNLFSLHDTQHNYGWGGNTWTDSTALWGTWVNWYDPGTLAAYYPQYVIHPSNSLPVFVFSNAGGAQIQWSRQTGNIWTWSTLGDLVPAADARHAFGQLIIGPDNLPWYVCCSETTNKLYIYRLNADWTVTTTEILTTTGAITGPTITRIGNGNAVIMWQDGGELWARQLDSSMAAVGADKRVTTIAGSGKVQWGTLRWQQFQMEDLNNLDWVGIQSDDNFTTYYYYTVLTTVEDLWPSGGGGGAFQRTYPQMPTERTYPTLDAARTYPL